MRQRQRQLRRPGFGVSFGSARPESRGGGNFGGAGLYRAFISYSHSDRKVADWLHRALEGYRIPGRLVGSETPLGPVPARLIPIFRDRDELSASGSLSAGLTAALGDSLFLVVICSPAAAQSRWVNEEVRLFKHLHGAGRVLALIADGDPADAGGRGCFPPALAFELDAGGAVTDRAAEPVAADIRPGKDGRRLALLKLAAGLTGLPLDALVQREAQRRQRRAALVSGLSLALAGVMAVLAVLALQGRREAERQRAEADGLVEYMLTDLREKLEPVGRLEVLDGVGRQALAYYGRQDLGALDADALGRRARALHLVGEVRDLRGDSEGALMAFREAERATAEQLARDPGNPERMFDHAQSVFWVGNVALQRKEWTTAEDRFARYAELADGMAATDPNELKWLKEQGYAANALGGLYIYQDRSQEAVPPLTRYVAITEEVARRTPGNSAARWEAGQARAWLADALLKLERVPDAKDHRLAELAIYAGILADDPGHADARLSLGRANEALAELHLRAGEIEAAAQRSQIAFESQKNLVASDPGNMLWLEMATGAAVQHAEALLLAGRIGDAAATNGWAMAQAARLSGTDPRSRPFRNLLMRSRMIEIATLFAGGRIPEARRAGGSFVADYAPHVGDDAGPTVTNAWLSALGMLAVERQAAGEGAAVQALVQALNAGLAPGMDGKGVSLHKALAGRIPGLEPATGGQVSRYPADRLMALAAGP